MRKELKQKINDIDAQIQKLNDEKEKLRVELLKIPTEDKGEQINNVVNYGGHADFLIEYSSRDGILSNMISNYQRHEIIHIENLMEWLAGLSYYAPTYKEQLEVFKMFGIEEDLDEEDYNEFKESSHRYERSFKDFEELWNDIVEASVSSFEFDW